MGSWPLSWFSPVPVGSQNSWPWLCTLNVHAHAWLESVNIFESAYILSPLLNTCRGIKIPFAVFLIFEWVCSILREKQCTLPEKHQGESHTWKHFTSEIYAEYYYYSMHFPLLKLFLLPRFYLASIVTVFTAKLNTLTNIRCRSVNKI